uniref:G-protein coupled receptors family 2 profile 1 domain-containing protein n=1 Tax=Eptatretus burgeri TaxID=7764 RepID=A0A8C4WPB5_EPTBU
MIHPRRVTVQCQRMRAAAPLGFCILLIARLDLALDIDINHPSCLIILQDHFHGVFSSNDIYDRNVTSCQWILFNPKPKGLSAFVKLSVNSQHSCQAFSIRLTLADSHRSSGNTNITIELCNEEVYKRPWISQWDNSNIAITISFSAGSWSRYQANQTNGIATTNEWPVGDSVELSFLFLDVPQPNEEACSVLCGWLESCQGASQPFWECGASLALCHCPGSGFVGRLGSRFSWEQQVGALGCDETKDGCLAASHSRSTNRALQSEPRWFRRAMSLQFPHLDSFPSLAKLGEEVGEQWSEWSVCSVTCGQGSQVRIRACSPALQGPPCVGAIRERHPCMLSHICPAHGAWEVWTQWSLCSLTCGRGVRKRRRVCNLPEPEGVPCEGPGTQTKVCNVALCPVDGHWAEWGTWTRCSVTCGSGTRQHGRDCVSPVHGGAECTGQWSETQSCTASPCPVHGVWSPWATWTHCSASCGPGIRRRSRRCLGPHQGGRPCLGVREETDTCLQPSCPEAHEVCEEEMAEGLLWGKSHAGRTTQRRCPPDATGKVSRRCVISVTGVAVWEPVLLINCTSLEMDLLQQSTLQTLLCLLNPHAAELCTLWLYPVVNGIYDVYLFTQ